MNRRFGASSVGIPPQTSTMQPPTPFAAQLDDIVEPGSFDVDCQRRGSALEQTERSGLNRLAE
jgi:hypothetical protein